MDSNSHEGYALVRVRGKEHPVIVPITSNKKPEIPENVTKNWKELLNIVAEILHVPASLIMKLHEEEIEVYLKSNNGKNPYENNEKAVLNTGLYCETVTGENRELLVPNSQDDDVWKDNPDVELGMISYLGFPVLWPDNEVFGTICVLDDKSNPYSDLYRKFLKKIKILIEKDLALLLEKNKLKQSLDDKRLLIREIHHRIKNDLNSLIAYINLQSYELNQDSISKFIKEIESRFHTISLIHDKLAFSVDEDQINLNEYLQDLAKMIISLFENEKRIQLHLRGDNLFTSIETAVTTGLLLNECLSNSLKYAFDEMNEGNVFLTIQKKEDGFFQMCFSDDGIGLPSNYESKRENSIGIQLIKALPGQLNGKTEIKPGKEYSICFTLQDAPKIMR